jgi:preprotein translocase subunit SecB
VVDIPKFGVKEIRLISARFDLKTDKEYKDKDISVSSTLGLRHNFMQNKKLLRLFMKVDVCGETLPFSLNVEIGGLFVFSSILKSDQSLDKIARINCAAILFPYLRETVADIVRRAGLPPLNLPPVNFVALYNAKPDEKVKKLK